MKKGMLRRANFCVSELGRCGSARRHEVMDGKEDGGRDLCCGGEGHFAELWLLRTQNYLFFIYLPLLKHFLS